MNFASFDIKQKISNSFSKTEGRQVRAPLLYLKNKNKAKYRQCLKLVQQWSQDLLERENNVHKLQQRYLQIEDNKQNQCSNLNNSGRELDLEEILAEEFVKKMQNIYMKQFMLRDVDEDSQKIKHASNETFSQMDYI